MFQFLKTMKPCTECHHILTLPIHTKGEIIQEYAWTPEHKLVRLHDGVVIGCQVCFEFFLKDHHRHIKHQSWMKDQTRIKFELRLIELDRYAQKIKSYFPLRLFSFVSKLKHLKWFKK